MMKLKSIDELFGEHKKDSILLVPIEDLEDYKDHPFCVKEDNAMTELIASISSNGIINPILVRSFPGSDSRYEIISGHRRVKAAARAGLKEIPVIVQELNDQDAVRFMCASNIYRPEILPSEKAKAFRLQLETCKVTQEQLADELGINRITIYRYLNLLKLIPKMLELVDQKKVPVNTGERISCLSPELQKRLVDIHEEFGRLPNLQQATLLKKLEETEMVSETQIKEVLGLMDNITTSKRKLTLKNIKEFFMFDDVLFEEEDISKIVFGLLTKWREEYVNKL